MNLLTLYENGSFSMFSGLTSTGSRGIKPGQTLYFVQECRITTLIVSHLVIS